MTSTTGPYKRRRTIRLGSFQDDLCFFCEQPLVYLDPNTRYDEHTERKPQANTASDDHYMSRKNGGSGRRENLVIACRVCNTNKGHEPTPEFDEKLRLLNIRRGYGDANGVVAQEDIRDFLEPSTFGSNSEALINLCSMANKIEGVPGQKIRRAIRRRINRHRELLKNINEVSPRGLKIEIVASLRKTRRESVQYHLPKDVDDHLENTLSTITKQWLG